MEYFSARKYHDLLIHTDTWVNFTNLILGERSPDTKKSTYYNVSIDRKF